MAIDFRKNATVLTDLHEYAIPKERTKENPNTVDGYELHTHPDLVERLGQLMGYTPGASLEYAYGVSVLCTPKGRIFAVTRGTNSLCLFLPGTTWGRSYAEFGEPWRKGRPWNVGAGKSHTQDDEKQYAALMQEAWRTAIAMDEKSVPTT